MFTPDYKEILKDYDTAVSELPESLQQKITDLEAKITDGKTPDEELEILDNKNVSI